jgi:uncharacterized membrane protein YhaH (DUF805 family)
MMADASEERRTADPQNPYQAPRSAVSNVAKLDYEPNLTWLLFSFKGRVNRARYWAAMLPTFLIYFLVVGAVEVLTGEESAARIVVLPVIAAFIWVSLSLRVKRWHDRDKSGFWIFINVIPIIGAIWELIEVGCLRGTVGDNRFGPDPLASHLSTDFGHSYQ